MIVFDGDREIIIPEEVRSGVNLRRAVDQSWGVAARVIAQTQHGQDACAIQPVKLSDEDKAYFQRRAEAEIALAQAAEHESAVRSHYLLAGYYLDLAHYERLMDAA